VADQDAAERIAALEARMEELERERATLLESGRTMTGRARPS